MQGEGREKKKSSTMDIIDGNWLQPQVKRERIFVSVFENNKYLHREHISQTLIVFRSPLSSFSEIIFCLWGERKPFLAMRNFCLNSIPFFRR